MAETESLGKSFSYRSARSQRRANLRRRGKTFGKAAKGREEAAGTFAVDDEAGGSVGGEPILHPSIHAPCMAADGRGADGARALHALRAA